MSFECIAKCLQINDIRPSSKLVLIMLGNFADENYQSYPSHSKLAQLCNCDDRTIRRCIDELKERKIITVKERYKDGKQISNLYTINLGVDKNVETKEDRVDKIVDLGGTKMYPNTIINKPINKKLINDYPKDFEIFWEEYPKSKNKKFKNVCYKQWKKVKEKELMLHCVKNYKKVQNPEFIHSPSRWIRDKLFLDFKEIKIEQTNKNNLAG
jgi:hypothetical protein